MPNQEDSTEDLNNLVDFYHEVWRLKPTEAANQAFEDQKRGTNSKIWQQRIKQVNDWKAKQADAVRPDSADAPAAPYDPAMNPYGAGAPPAPKPYEPNPETAMRDPRLVYAKAYAMQDKLNERRAALAKLPPTAKVGFEPMYQFYREGLGLSPEEAVKQATAQYQQGLANAAMPDMPPAQPSVPISPGPLKPAAPTPHHLEDANLSSWQSLAQMLGYGPFRK